MIVGGKQGARADYVVQVLGHCPGNGHTVVGRSSAPDLVENDKALAGRVAQDVRGLAHFQQEGGFAACQVVARAHPGKHAVAQADARRARGNETPRLGQDHTQGGLANQRRFSRHVRPGHDEDLLALGIQAQIIGHEAAGGGQTFHHRMPAVPQFQHLGIVDHGPAIAVMVGLLGQGRDHVGGGHPSGQRKNPRGCRAHLVAQA